MNQDILYHERISSPRTEALFLGLTLLFLSLTIWRLNSNGLDFLTGVLATFFVLFLFYTLNFRTLVIRLTPERLELKFGVFRWRVPLEDVASCQLDELPAFKRFGGAGIHFMMVRGKYRASFNFLEHARVVVLMKKKKGPVCEISFSTRRPDDVIRAIQESPGYLTGSDLWAA